MKRTYTEIAETAKVNPRYDMTAAEIMDLLSKGSAGKEELFDVISTAFKYGYVQGTKATLAANR